MTITLKVSENTQKEMINYFQDTKRENTPPYAVFQAKEADTVITLYNSGKVVFQGVSADIDASMWKQRERHLNPTKKIEETNSEKKEKTKQPDTFNPLIYNSNTIGSDEVGTGDFFGPIVVTASYVSKENIKFLENLNVKDSKKLTDEKILEIVPQIIKKIPYETIIISNSQYNLQHNQTSMNMNKIKAILHNKVLTKMSLQYKADYIVIDQFAKEQTYYRYLEQTNALKKLTFLTKAEDKCLSVAAAALIARFVFLKEMDKLSKELNIEIPKGCNEQVIAVSKKIVDKYGLDKLKEVAKCNFKTYEIIKNNSKI